MRRHAMTVDASHLDMLATANTTEATRRPSGAEPPPSRRSRGARNGAVQPRGTVPFHDRTQVWERHVDVVAKSEAAPNPEGSRRHGAAREEKGFPLCTSAATWPPR